MLKQDQKLARFGGDTDVAPRRRALRQGLGLARLLGNSRGVVALEFAILSVPFFTLMLFVMEVAYDLYSQAALDAALFTAVRNLQTGNAQNLTSTTGVPSPSSYAFIQNYLCPAANGLLECNTHMFVNVQKFTPAPINASTATTDYWNITTGNIPVNGNTLNLSAYTSATSFCNVAPQQFILVSAIYLGPSFVGGLLPHVLSYYIPAGIPGAGQLTHASLSTLGVATEVFSPVGAQKGTTPLPPC